mmetsp:Transcript_5484/g.10697  ORF Transcript_5484/g.10697 Transcript_5484/m.10697 type:complete len:208 (-) Transcript_5484:173-796(-)
MSISDGHATMASSFMIQSSALCCGDPGVAISAGLDTSCANSVMFLARSSGVRLHGNVGAGVVGAMKTGVGLGVGLVVVGIGEGTLEVAPAVGLIVETSTVGDSVVVMAVGFAVVMLALGDPVMAIAVGFAVTLLVVGFSDVAPAVGLVVVTITVGLDVDVATGLEVGLNVMTVGLFVGFVVTGGMLPVSSITRVQNIISSASNSLTW